MILHPASFFTNLSCHKNIWFRCIGKLKTQSMTEPIILLAHVSNVWQMYFPNFGKFDSIVTKSYIFYYNLFQSAEWKYLFHTDVETTLCHIHYLQYEINIYVWTSSVCNFDNSCICETCFEAVVHAVRCLIEYRYWKISKLSILFSKVTRDTHCLKVFRKTVSFHDRCRKGVKCSAWKVSINSTKNEESSKIAFIIDTLFY